MEDLIAAYPTEFFPRHSLTLTGRQQSFQEVGRFDLLFADEFGTQILMELKAVTAKYENATQLARYRDALRQCGTANVLMWLVSPSIPRSVRDFLDQVGIEYTEIHESEFRQVAARHGYPLTGEQTAPSVSAPVDKSLPTTKPLRPSHESGDWFFNTDEGEVRGAYRKMLEQSCVALWGYKDSAERLSKPAAGQRVFFFLNGVGVIASGVFTDQAPTRSNSIFGKESEHEFHRMVSGLVTVKSQHALTPSDVAQWGYRLPCLKSLCRISSSRVATQMAQELERRSKNP